MEEKIMEMKTGHYSSDANDFQADDELMVTITLHEYRDLVDKKAAYYERNKHLESELEKLKGQA